jgi:hypothetical protein
MDEIHDILLTSLKTLFSTATYWSSVVFRNRYNVGAVSFNGSVWSPIRRSMDS